MIAEGDYMDLYLGIDGTGPSNNDEYRRDFANSYVRKIWSTWGANNAGYLRGPGVMGGETMNLVETGFQWVTGRVKDLNTAKTPYRLFLSGYSRGGAAATELAFRLKGQGIGVHGLVLFDAVDRSNLGNAEVVPSNVIRCFHARRDPAAGSREGFGNCATRAELGVAYTEKFFFGTHGAVGGTPWTVAGASGKIEELTTSNKIAAAALGTLLGGAAGGTAAKRAADNQDFTNVTLAQEKAAAVAVWEWISGHLATTKSLATAGGGRPLAGAGRSEMA
jgi:pimeloyl-ACP methyl ester carboxylesterase